MTAQFPTALVTTTNIPNANPATSLSANNHSGKHDDMRDEIIALETKVGINGSAVTTTHDYKLSGVTGSDKAVGATQTVTVTNKTLGSGTKMGLGSDATGDTYYNSGSGTVSRLGIGSSGQALLSNGSTPYWGSPSSTNTNYASDTGAANAYVVTLSPVPGAYTAGMLVQFKASNANTTTSTVNVNSLGAKTIVKPDGSALSANEIKSGQIVELEYDGTNFQMISPSGIALTSTGDGSGLTNLPGNKLSITTTDVTFSSSTAENTLLSYSLAGGVLSTGNAVRVTMHVSALGTFNTATATIRFKYGGTTFTTHTLGGTATSSFSGKMEFILAGAGTTSSQNGSSSINLGTNGYIGNGNLLPQYFASSLQGTSSIDSTASQTLLITYQASASSASDNITVSMIVVEKIV